jgi:hypothetical protein
MILQRWLAKTLTLALAFTLCGLPEVVQAQQQATPQSGQQPQQQQQQPANGTTVDPSLGPQQPVPSTNNDQAPSPSQYAPDTSQTLPPPPPQQPMQQPLGTATAEGVPTVGGAASRPAGEAIAPAKQNQRRSLLIKIGLIAAAGAAGGIVYGLSKSSPSKP